MHCCECDSEYEEKYYKYDNEIYCFDCLVDTLEKEGQLNVVKVTHYYTDDWGELGTDDEINEVIENICDTYDIEEVEGY